MQRLEAGIPDVWRRGKAVNCPAIDGIIEEADEAAGEVEDKTVLDAALINAAQAAEHYEITRYGSLIAWARQLGRNDCAGILQKTLDEEKVTDKKLTALAEGKVNLRGGELVIFGVLRQNAAREFFARRFCVAGRVPLQTYFDTYRIVRAKQEGVLPMVHHWAKPCQCSGTDASPHMIIRIFCSPCPPPDARD